MRPLALVFSLLAPALAMGAVVDFHGPLPSGGLRLAGAPALRLVKERVEIESAEEGYRTNFSIEYRIANDTAAEISAEVVFDEPSLEWKGIMVGAPSIEDVRFFVGGVPVKPRREVRATTLDGKRDVTVQLSQMGVPPIKFPEEWVSPPDFWLPLGEAKLKKLEAAGLLIDFIPKWRTLVAHRWSQAFPPMSETVLKLEYRAFPGCCDQYLEEVQRPACLAGEALRSVRARSPRGEVRVRWPSFSFEPQILPAQAKVELEVVVRHPPGWVASYCWKSTVEQISPTTLRARGDSMAPTKDLTVFFFQL